MLNRSFFALLFPLMLASSAALAQTAPSSAPLRCAGTEPFWSVLVAEGKMTHVMPGPTLKTRIATLRVRTVSSAAGVSPEVVRIIRSQNARLTVIAGSCSDGMSDLEYAYHAVYEHAGMVLYGCCRDEQ
jgi:uncharacterized membrane protein